MGKRRTSILVERDTYERYVRRARRKGTTVSEEMRAVLHEALEDEHPNQAWLDLMEEMEQYADDFRPGPPIDSDETKEEFARVMVKETMNREPDW